MFAFVRRFLRNESGATAIEYGLIAALVSIAVVSAAAGIGGGVQTKFQRVDSAVG